MKRYICGLVLAVVVLVPAGAVAQDAAAETRDSWHHRRPGRGLECR